MSHPDIVFINCHDLGRHLSIYGEATVKTPALERIADEGIVFERFFSTSTMCSPSRGSIQTGRYPHQIGLYGLANRSGWDMNVGERCIPHFLKQIGYDTILFGLQHESHRPIEEALGYKARVPLKSPHPAPVWSVAEQVATYIDSLAPRRDRPPVYITVGIFEPHRHDFWQRYQTTDPDSLHVPGFLPDTPSVRKDLARYEGLIMAMDEGVGTILDALDRAGISDSTLVLFTTDHGIGFPRAKCTAYDAGIGVAGLARWPERVAAGSRTDALLSHIDWLPTLLEIIDLEKPDNVEGYSFLPLLVGDAYEPRDVVYAEGTYHTVYNPMRCIRTADYKLIRNYDSNIPVAGSNQENRNNGILGVKEYPPETWAPRPAWELYRIEVDPNERDNLSGREGYERIEAALRNKLEAWLERTHDAIHEIFSSFYYGPAHPSGERFPADPHRLVEGQW